MGENKGPARRPAVPGQWPAVRDIRNRKAGIPDPAKRAQIPAGFRPHSLRHAFASVMLARGIPITDVAQWLGHKDINEIYRTYGHLVPNAAGRAVAALDAEYAEWSSKA